MPKYDIWYHWSNVGSSLFWWIVEVVWASSSSRQKVWSPAVLQQVREQRQKVWSVESSGDVAGEGTEGRQ